MSSAGEANNASCLRRDSSNGQRKGEHDLPVNERRVFLLLWRNLCQLWGTDLSITAVLTADVVLRGLFLPRDEHYGVDVSPNSR